MQSAYSAICQMFELHLLHVNRKLYLLSSLTFMVNYMESGKLCTFSVYLPVVTWYECLFLFRIACDVSSFGINNIQGSAHPILIQEGKKKQCNRIETCSLLLIFCLDALSQKQRSPSCTAANIGLNTIYHA